MGWYQVTKTINGRQYVYLQMTYREGGKVKTKNKYLGPASSAGASFGFGAPANLPVCDPALTHKPPGGLRITKIRRLKPKTRAAMWNEANRRRLTDQYKHQQAKITHARWLVKRWYDNDKELAADVVAPYKEEQREIRRLYRQVFRKPMKIKK